MEEELLSGRAVEGDRIEYKTGWNVTVVFYSKHSKKYPL